MKLYKVILCLLIYLTSCHPVYAVDGYKDIKFGTSLEDFKKHDICHSMSCIQKTINGVEALFLTDFYFYGSQVTVNAFFIDDKFLRFVIPISYEDRHHMLTALSNKYGVMSSQPSSDTIDNFSKLPNQEMGYGFDNDTVCLRYVTDEYYAKTMLLIYTSHLFDKRYKELRNKILINDL